MNVFLLRAKGASEPRSAIESGLKATIPGLIEVSSFDRVLERKSGATHDPDIIVVIAPSEDSGYFNRLVDVATQYRSEIFIILISEEISASDYKRLVRTGGADWASARGGPREVADIIARRGEVESVSGISVPGGGIPHPVTIAFIPSAGGVGNTTLAIETAIHLKKGKSKLQRKICIVDLDFQNSNICDYLDSEPRLVIEELSNAPERLDQQLFDSFKTHHSSGVDVFAAPRSKFASEGLNINALDALFSRIAKHYDLVFVDFPVIWFPWTAQVIAASDGVIVTAINTIPNLRQTAETLVAIRSNSKAIKTGIILNRCDKTLLGAISRSKQVEKVLRNETLFFVANHPEATEAVNMGVPMALHGAARKLHKELTPVADFCAGVKSSRLVST